MTKFEVPTREQVTPENQAIFDNLNSQTGFRSQYLRYLCIL
jgi:hypothetical protein